MTDQHWIIDNIKDKIKKKSSVYKKKLNKSWYKNEDYELLTEASCEVSQLNEKSKKE